MITKTADSRGRINLGRRFANRTVIIERTGPTRQGVLLIKMVPERETWLHKNLKAKASVLRGLAQARACRMAKSPPDLQQDALLLEQLQD